MNITYRKKTITMINNCFLFLIIVFFSCEQPAENQKLLQEKQTFEQADIYEKIEKEIQLVNDSSFIYENNPYSTFDISSYTENATKDLVNFINEYNLNPDFIKGLKNNASLENTKTYSYGYWSGGTRGFITYSILTIKRGSKFLAANLSENIEARFDSIIKLNDEFYLLLGGDKADGSAYDNIAYVIRLTDKIDVTYPAFVNRPFLNFSNGTYKYDNSKSLLIFQGEDYERIDEIFNYKNKYRKYSSDSLSSIELYKMIKGERYFDTKSFILQFNGKNFERFDKNEEE